MSGMITVVDYVSLCTVRYLTIDEKEIDFIVKKYLMTLGRYESNANTIEFLLA